MGMAQSAMTFVTAACNGFFLGPLAATLGSVFILSSSLTAESTGRVEAGLKGSLLGTEHALFSAVRVFSPSMAVTVLDSYGVLGLTASSAAIYTSATALWILSGGAVARGDVKNEPVAPDPSGDKANTKDE
eukprot:scaffold647906_cov35-Prasinocladus_malaysianus.AAC.3